MKSMKMFCPRCRGEIEPSIQSSNSRVVCPHCTFQFVPAQTAAPTPSKQSQTSQPRKGKNLFVIVTVIVVGVIALIIGFNLLNLFIRTAAPLAASVNTPPLELVSWHWYERGNYAIAEGEVLNKSSKALGSIQVVVSYYTDADEFITTGNAIIDFNPILPGQSSPFKAYARYNPKMTTALIRFKHVSGAEIKHSSRSQP